jgi:hypothetical protein
MSDVFNQTNLSPGKISLPGVIASCCALIFGWGVFAISIGVEASTLTNSVPLTARSFYLTSELLPDHALYPFLMVVDRVQFDQTSDHDRVKMAISLSFQRIEAAKTLLAKRNNHHLAETTITKSQKYLLLAALEWHEHAHEPYPQWRHDQQYVLSAIQAHQQQTSALLASIDANLHGDILNLQHQLQVVADQIVGYE